MVTVELDVGSYMTHIIQECSTENFGDSTKFYGSEIFYAEDSILTVKIVKDLLLIQSL